jgi:hypothetical protein
MVTITLDKLSQQPLSKDLHFGDLSSFLKFLQDNDYITQVGVVDDADLSSNMIDQINKNLSLDRSLFVDVTQA